MATSIQVSQELKEVLSQRKLDSKDSYEEVIWDLLEDTMELSEETKRNIEIGRKQIAEGKFITHEDLKKKLGL